MNFGGPPGIFGMRIRAGEYDSDEFVPAFHFEADEGWQATGLLETTDQITLAVEVEVEVKAGDYVSSEGELIFTKPSHVFDASNLSENEVRKERSKPRSFE
jgi:hypothetical protein